MGSLSNTTCPIMLDEGAPAPSPALAAVLDSHKRYIPAPVAKAHRRRLHRVKAARPQCTWCGGPVKPPKQTYCSDACVAEWTLRTSGTVIRRRVFARDRGVCAECGTDTEKIRNVLKLFRWHALFQTWRSQNKITRITQAVRDQWEIERTKLERQAVVRLQALDEFWHRFVPNAFGAVATLWDADHVVRVVDGGGQCGLLNLQTLCRKCHDSKTRRGNKK